MKSIFNFLHNQKGIALLIVLSSLMILTTAVVEFTYNSRINYQLAVNAKQKLQAYYLARSSLSFSKLLLKYYKESQTLLQKASDAGQNIVTEPLYRMLPLSSELIRGIIDGSMTSLLSGEQSGPSDGSADEAVPTPNLEDEAFINKVNEEQADKAAEGKSDMGLDMGPSMLATVEAQKFLNFSGDFSSEITEENSKFDLNTLANKESNSDAYDQRKKLLYSYLMLPRFEKVFENHEVDAQNLVNALGDWVDANDTVNDFDKVERGGENSIYRDVDYKVKNGKMLTLSEMRLVSGMNDQIYSLLKNAVTVYTGVDPINVCVSPDSEDWVSAMIYFYTHYANCGSPIDYSDTDKMVELVSTVLSGCPDVNAMASSLNSQLGLADLQDEVAGDNGKTSPTTGAKVAGCSFQFKDLLGADNKVFTIKAMGQVGETSLTIETVVNIDNADPSLWKYYYYHVE